MKSSQPAISVSYVSFFVFYCSNKMDNITMNGINKELFPYANAQVQSRCQIIILYNADVIEQRLDIKCGDKPVLFNADCLQF